MTAADFKLSVDEELNVMDYAILDSERIYILNKDKGLISFAYSNNNKVTDVQKFSFD